MKVIAKKGTKCPKEGKPREYITDQDPADVLETVYYLRLIEDGSLQPVKNATGVATARKTSKKREVKKNGKQERIV